MGETRWEWAHSGPLATCAVPPCPSQLRLTPSTRLRTQQLRWPSTWQICKHVCCSSLTKLNPAKEFHTRASMRAAALPV